MATLTLAWPQPVRAESATQDGELVIRVSQPLQYEAFTGAMPQLTRWVAGAYFGYDSVAFTLTPGTIAEAAVSAGQLVVRFRAGHATPEPVSEPLAATESGEPAVPTAGPRPLSPALRLRLLKAIILWSLGETLAASDLLDDLAATLPDNLDVLGAQASVQHKLGRWRLATAALDRAHQLAGIDDRPGLPLRGSEAVPQLTLDWLSDTQGDQAQRAGLHAVGQFFLADGLRAQLGYDYADVTVPAGPLQKAAAASNVTSQLLTAGLRYDATSGSWFKLAVLGAADQAIGGNLAGALWDTLGTTELAGSWRERRLDVPSLTFLRAQRDSVGLLRTLRSSSALARATGGDVSAQGGLRWDRWSDSHSASQPTAWVASASVQWVSWLTRPRIAVHYGWQWMAMTTARAAVGDALGNAIVGSHFHTLSFSASLPVWRWLGISAFGSYGANIGGADVIQAGAEVGWTPPVGVRIAGRYQYGASAESYGLATTGARVSAGWFF